MQLCLIKLQKLLHVNRIKNKEIILKKGTNWFSITNDLAHFVIRKEKEIQEMYRYGWCVDEVFLQTLAYNSKFRNKIVDDSLRYIDWIRGFPYTFHEEDFNEIISSNKLFARKFSKKIDYKIVLKIESYLKGYNKDNLN